MPNTRTLDPSTSHQAEKSVKGLAESYRIITELMKLYGPMNDEQLIQVWPQHTKRASQSGIRSRRSELVAAGLLEDSGERITMPSGRASIVWRLV